MELKFSDILDKPITSESWTKKLEVPLEAIFKTNSVLIGQKVAKAVHMSHILEKHRTSSSTSTN